MAKRDKRDDDKLLGRLQDAASGEAAVRQLRRRYDALRDDYESLLDRLAELEDRLEASGDVEPRTPSPRAGAPAPAGSLSEAIMAPLMQLRAEYLAAATSIHASSAPLTTPPPRDRASRGAR